MLVGALLKSVPSSWLNPSMTGTFATLPAATNTRGSSGSTTPSIVGPHSSCPDVRPPCFASSVVSFTDRMHASTSAAEPQPRFLASCGRRVEEMLYGCADQPLKEPDSMMPPWKRPCEPGETRWSDTLAAPADSPKIVTRDGLPPNAAMLLATNCARPRGGGHAGRGVTRGGG